ncbi:MAG: C-GCAxxG-C-C family protein [Bacillota bacterium]|nr:C-GCAxxG-C-C family protein [Bacillota bacterium]
MGYLAEEVGYPFNLTPPEAFTPFKGGIYGWGSICGALVAPIATIAMLFESSENEALINELMAFYKDAAFPQFQPKGLNVATTVANSNLCHVSVTTWMQATGLPRTAPERSERCAGVTADVCKFTVEMLNKYMDKAFVSEFKPAAVVGECMSCHDSTKNISPAYGKEDCTSCHDDPHKS